MKKILSIIFALLVSVFVFAENNISLKTKTSIAPLSYERSGYQCHSYKFNLDIGAEYLYNFDFGLTLGAEFLINGIYFIESSQTTPTVVTDASGSGFDIAPSVGWTFNAGKTYIQALVHPVAFELGSYNDVNATASLNNVALAKAKNTKDVSYSFVKSGLDVTFQWGWEHFKLGVGAGGNLIYLGTFGNDKLDGIGFEIGLVEKFTFIF